MRATLMAALAALLAFPAFAQSTCGDRAAIIRQLAEKYNEARIGVGIERSGNMMEVFAAPSGSWTVLMTTPGGATCLVAAGEDWEAGALPIALGDPA